jgi:hypothetical protein
MTMVEYERTADGRTVEVRRGNPVGWLVALVLVALLVVAAFAFGLIKIDQTQDARLPDVKVSTTGGQAPKFDVDTAKVDVGTKTEDVSLPKVKVDTEKTAIKVPTVDVQRADDPNKKD